MKEKAIPNISNTAYFLNEREYSMWIRTKVAATNKKFTEIKRAAIRPKNVRRYAISAA